MDWTKAKTILIGALLVANIFLLYLFVDKEKNPTEDVLQDETIALLEAKQIFVQNTLPPPSKKMSVLMIEYINVEESKIFEKIHEQSEPIDYSNAKEENIEIADKFLKTCDINYSTARFWKCFEENFQGTSFSTVYYINEYKGIKVEDSYIICKIAEGKVIDLEIFWLKPTGHGKAKKATISPSAALIELMRNKEGTEAIFVDNIEMIYWLDPSFPPGETAVADTALPTWKIEYNDGACIYVPAYTD